MKAFLMPETETDSWIEQRIVILVLKFLTEHVDVSKNGLMSIKPFKVEIDGAELTYEQLQKIDPRTNKGIKIIQDNGPMPETRK